VETSHFEMTSFCRHHLFSDNFTSLLFKLYGCKIIQENGPQVKCYVSHMTSTGTQYKKAVSDSHM